MARYTLDTNVLIDALNHGESLGALLHFLRRFLAHTSLSAIVLHEVEAGLTSSRQADLWERELAGPFARRGRLFAPSVGAWRQAGQHIRKGVPAPTPSALNDLLLAVSCREAGITLITRDKDFRRLSRSVGGFRSVAPFPV